MLRIKTLELVHWDYWQRFTLPLDVQIVTIVGPNGSGKTTLLDALRTLFALNCSGRRDYKRYVRRSGAAFAWLRAVVDNRRSDAGGHPFFPLLEDTVTLACRINKHGGDWSREYLIAPNDTPIEELQQCDYWIGTRDYQARLAGAGLTPAITRVLALEQGDTDKLCEYSPKALLDLVFDVFGDKEVLDHYTRARQEQREAQRELQELELDLARLENQVETKISEANRYQEWKALTQERERLVAEIIPRLDLAELRESIAGAHSQLVGQRRKLQEHRQQLETTLAQFTEIKRTLAAATDAEAAAQEQAQRCAGTSERARDAMRETEGILQEEQRLVSVAQAGRNFDARALARTLAVDESRLAGLRDEQRKDQARAEEIAAQNAALQSGTLPAEPVVQAFRNALAQEKITHAMLGDVIEITDSGWQPAVEAILHAYRHIVLLEKPQDRSRAWALGETLKYRHFIVAERIAPDNPRAGSLLDVVRFRAPAPAWLADLLNRITRVEDAAAGASLPSGRNWVTRAGYYKEQRGARYAGIAPHEFQFGDAARRARIAALLHEQDGITRRNTERASETAQLDRRIAQSKALLAGVDAAEWLAARAQEFLDAHDRLPRLKEDARRAANALEQAGQHAREATEARHAIDLAIGKIEADREKLEAELKQEIAASRDLRSEQAKRIGFFRHQRRDMPIAWYQRAGLRELVERHGRAESARNELSRLEHKLTREDWITDESVMAVRDKLKADLAARNEDVNTRRTEYQRAVALTDDARAAYINKLRATVRTYGRNVRRLGELAGVEVQCETPHLENDDLVLAQAGLNVSFDFDRKGMAGLNDGEASGGQQVMKSLILLIGLMMDETRPGGFVFIDEPFAHLDIFNIDRVGAFLQATRAQYLITTPNTHNINVFGPSELTLVTRKKQPHETWAQPVAVMRRQGAATHV